MTVGRSTGANEPEASTIRRVGRYSLVSELGSGPLGVKWLGFVTEGAERGRVITARRVVTAGDSAAASLLERAANVAREVRHARFAAVLDVVRAPGEVVVISEQLDGESLASLLHRSVKQAAPISPAVALAVIRDLVDAILAGRDAWRAAVTSAEDPLWFGVHGGLHPDGVLVASFGEALVTDLGVSGAAAMLSRFGRRPIALQYRAPEQLDETIQIDERVDVFTLGVLLWEMLAGQPLFGPSERLRRPTAVGAARDLERDLREKKILTLDTVQRPGVPIPAQIALLAARALQRDPASRYVSLSDLRAAICALPDTMVATSEQVAGMVDRLARSEIDGRRAAFERAVGGRLMGSTPPSSRSARDMASPPSRPITVVVPGAEWRGDALVESVRFGADEVPTRSGSPVRHGALPILPPVPPRERMDDEPANPAPRMGVQATTAPLVSDPAPAPGSEVLLPPPVSEETGAPVWQGVHAMDGSTGWSPSPSDPAVSPEPSRRRGGRTLSVAVTLLLLFALLGVAVAAAVASRERRSLPVQLNSPPDDGAEKAESSTAPTVPMPEATREVKPVPAPADSTAVRANPSKSDTPAASPADGSWRTGNPRPEEGKPPRSPAPSPSATHKGYRPRGI